MYRIQRRRKIDNWGGGGGGGHIFIYSCSQTVKTMDFKILISISKESAAPDRISSLNPKFRDVSGFLMPILLALYYT